MKRTGDILEVVKPLIDARRFDEAAAELNEAAEAVDILQRLYQLNQLASDVKE